jgi:hypothetical protein
MYIYIYISFYTSLYVYTHVYLYTRVHVREHLLGPAARCVPRTETRTRVRVPDAPPASGGGRARHRPATAGPRTDTSAQEAESDRGGTPVRPSVSF